MPLKKHQKILNEAAREVLLPAGLRQKGTSRLWYLDCDWYACFAEFQAFSGRQGTTLNFGISWFWYPREHWVFDVSNRVDEFFDYHDEITFRSTIFALSNQVIEYCSKTREAIKIPADAYAYVENNRAKKDWHAFNLAILAGLAGRTDTALSLFDAAYVSEAKFAWQSERNKAIEELEVELTDRQTFQRSINGRMNVARGMLKLADSKTNFTG